MICKYPYTDTHCIHNPHKCDQEIDQVRLHNFLLHKLSLPLFKFYLCLGSPKGAIKLLIYYIVQYLL
jgi:hypothetical protein